VLEGRKKTQIERAGVTIRRAKHTAVSLGPLSLPQRFTQAEEVTGTGRNGRTVNLIFISPLFLVNGRGGKKNEKKRGIMIGYW